MTIIMTLGVVLLALICFVGEWFPADITAIAVMVILMTLGLVTPEEGISGFSNSATITVLAMFILSAGIARTGAVQVVSNWFITWGGKRPSRQILVMGAIVGPISGFINNTAVVAVFLPIVEDWCRKQGISPSKLLMPLSYVTVLGGMLTVIGTSTNVLASGLSEQLGYQAFGLFEFTAVGLITGSVGLLYLAFIAPRWLPNRQALATDPVLQRYGLNGYISEIVISPGSTLVGQSLRSSQLQRQFDMDVMELIRNGEHFSQPIADKVLQAGDVLLVRGRPDCLLRIKEAQGIEILPEVQFGQLDAEPALTASEGIAEVLILPNAEIVGSTLKETRFRQRYNATVLAIQQGQAVRRDRLGQVPIQFGDVLLVQGPKQSLLGLQTSPGWVLIEQKEVGTFRREKAGIAIAILIGVVVLAALEWVPILVSAWIGVVLMLLTSCLRPGELYQAVRWDIIFLLAGLIPLGIAMEKSGATQWLADAMVALGGQWSGYGLLTLFFVITSLVTEILSNNACVVLLLPIAAKVAETLSLNPYAFMFTVMFAASNSFMTPIGYQTNTMVYGPGGYRFTDFLWVGTPMNLLMALITPPLIMAFYGL
ncbi:SLC13 family permease [Romeria aff. gracilis LEGE 07310]|uniref:SLC13 family permease n=1 Tax=Vasconcelosia minhoensis LEGE 07310 TaxID=915328 RepID=A0A8J7AIJ7_9CYAN|nr:SLC13 family permease [Romeria gracilis]MBE9078223.1 SLC13 family permease [Romeria aff. gracilis LEGE 07310]